MIFLDVLNGRLAFDLIDDIFRIFRRIALERRLVDEAKLAFVLFDLFMRHGRGIFNPIPEDNDVGAEFVLRFLGFFFAAFDLTFRFGFRFWFWFGSWFGFRFRFGFRFWFWFGFGFFAPTAFDGRIDLSGGRRASNFHDLVFFYILDRRLAFKLTDDARSIFGGVSLERILLDEAKLAFVLFDLFMRHGRGIFNPIPEDNDVRTEFPVTDLQFAFDAFFFAFPRFDGAIEFPATT